MKTKYNKRSHQICVSIVFGEDNNAKSNKVKKHKSNNIRQKRDKTHVIVGTKDRRQNNSQF